jgi:hypothetical protein
MTLSVVTSGKVVHILSTHDTLPERCPRTQTVGMVASVVASGQCRASGVAKKKARGSAGDAMLSTEGRVRKRGGRWSAAKRRSRAGASDIIGFDVSVGFCEGGCDYQVVGNVKSQRGDRRDDYQISRTTVSRYLENRTGTLRRLVKRQWTAKVEVAGTKVT